jgi:hypothetical protein
MMKSKQKLERKTQSVSEDSPPVVSKQQDFFTSSTVPSQETTKLDKHGRTPTKIPCYSCGVSLVSEENWSPSMADRGQRMCKGCFNSKHNKKNNKQHNPERMWVNGKYIPKRHPLYKAGSYKGFEEAAFSSLQNFKDSPQGQVYIITNPAWEGWAKVGMAVDSEDRLKNYQTSSPERDYELFDYEEFDDRRVAESMVHDYLRKRFKHKNEWFECSAESAMKAIDAIHSELHGSAMMLNDLCDAADDFGDVYLGDGVWLRA